MVSVRWMVVADNRMCQRLLKKEKGWEGGRSSQPLRVTGKLRRKAGDGVLLGVQLGLASRIGC